MSTTLHLLSSLGNLVPRAEGPLPDSIDLSFPFTLAGMGSLIGRLVRPGTTAAQRDRFVWRWSVWAGVGGCVLYGFVFTHQLLSE
jgi:hypothetical protein